MKSVIVANVVPAAEQSGYTELQVLRSNAGYYVGTMYRNVEADGSTWEEPGSRDSGYFRSREEAQRFLDTVEACNLTGALRQTP
jgi:hypothetical protein